MTTSSITDARLNQVAIGERIALGRYRTAAGVERVLYAQRIATVVRVTDVPADGKGRAYLVERGLERDGYAALLALVQDYLARADDLGIPPIAATAVL
jgi:hypothetical protein